MEFGIKGDHEELNWLKPMLRRWGHLIDDYCAIHPKDVPYYYNERANVGLLAAAAWGPGSGSLEEYACERDHDEGQVRWGRADLYLYDQNNSATIEAKQIWWTPQTTENHIRAQLEAAANQAGTNREANVAVAAVFATLMLSCRDDVQAGRADVQAQCRRAVDQMNNVGTDLTAWVMPCMENPLVHNNRDEVSCLWPGIVLGLQVVV
ncbi:MAG: hypothetical protein NVV74_07825 [Magnetospirillum sp.]|nr:hypothetical protein [Magnetospirillum sp.]